MSKIRFIPRLDIKGDKLIKSIQLEGVKVVGDPREHAVRYYAQGADELLFMDAVASLYGRNHLADIIRYTAGNVFVPLTVGGGLRSVEDVDAVLKSGADKVAINTAAVARPELIREVAHAFGSQCMVLQLDAKRWGEGQWEVYVDGGRERSGLDAVTWATQATALGAGEILVTSVDNEGTRRGFDLALCAAIARAVPIPVIASGGMGSLEHLVGVVRTAGVDAVAMADILHIQHQSLTDIKRAAQTAGIDVRLQ